MELFLELTRRCNLKCSHCLRGEAEGKDMSEHILWYALRTLGNYGYIGIGGGEPAMSDKHLRKLRNAILQTSTYPDCFYMVTNGKRLSENRELIRFLDDFPAETIYLHVSTDQWHESDAKINYKIILDELSGSEKIQVHHHGPTSWSNIVTMGRGKGKNCTLCEEDGMLYVDVYGYVWGSCDLSYTFMQKFRDKAICYGNVVTDSEETIMNNYKLLSEYLNFSDTVMEYSENNGGYSKAFIRNELLILQQAI